MTRINSSIIEIDGKKIGEGNKPYIVAEMSGNHNGSIKNALKIIKTANECGADAVKIQTYTPDTITINHNGPEFIIKDGLWEGRKLYELYEEAHTPWEWHQEMFEYAKKIGITLFSSPFDYTAVNLLESLNNPIYKIASPEIIDLELIKKMAKTKKPLIISTGMATLFEIEEAIKTANLEGANQIVVLHCTSSYPAPIKEANLSTICEIREKFNVITGLSDHTKGTFIPTLAIALGASVIEKHFTLDRSKGGVDSEFSIEPKELEKLVQDCESANIAKGTPAFKPTDSESIVLKNRRSIYVVKKINKGELITTDNVRSIRPGKGLLPKYINKIIGHRASRDIEYGEAFELSMIMGEVSLD
ncbi:pseudaminic acid synthase [Prochlorococcus marinus]|uniref:pseudaminic acid synthase n=1 Tax=Prochlorococcus marinus TaxID=1219 RepID=UPI0022B475DA|nr:pseudaminic acid synthase [Prochlorococcus marinus]